MRTPEHGRRAERRRLKAVTLAKAGWSASAIGRHLGVDPRSVRRWKATFRRRGQPGLRTKAAPGQPCRLSALQRHGLTRRLLGGARTQGFSTDLWTCPRIARLIERQYEVRYHVDHIPRLMHTLGFSVQKPERQARERDEAAIRGWIARDWRRIKKRRPPIARRSCSSTKQASS